MILGFRARNRRRIGRETQGVLLFSGPGGPVPEGIPSAVAGLWGAQGSGKSSLVDQLAWLREAVTDGPTRWGCEIPVEPHRGEVCSGLPTTAGIGIQTAGGACDYELSATAEDIVREVLHVETPLGVVLERSRTELELGRSVAQPAVLRALCVGERGRRRPALGAGVLYANEALEAVHRAISAIRIVRLYSIDRADLQAVAVVCEDQSPKGSPAARRRALVAGLLRGVGIDVGDVDLAGTAGVRNRVAVPVTARAAPR